MHLLNPAALWLLPLIVILFLLPRLRRPRVRFAVGNPYMWQPLERSRAPHALVRFQRHWTTVLQAIVMVLLITALARPTVFTRARDAVFIVDLSMSMSAAADGRTRLDLARDAARARLRELPRLSHVRVIAAGTSASDLGAFGASDPALTAVLRGLRAGAGPDRIGNAIAEARAKAGSNTDLYVFTDQPQRDQAAFWTRVGSPADNMAVTALAGRRLPGSAFDAQLLVEIGNFGAARREVPIAIRQDQTLLRRELIALEAHGSTAFVVNLTNPAGVYSATIESGDAILLDNQRFTTFAAARRDVSLITSGNYFLERALEANHTVNVRRVSPGDVVDPRSVVVCDGCREAPAGSSAVLMIPPPDPTGDAFLLQAATEHPLLANVDVSNVTARLSARAAVPSGTVALVKAGEIPAIAAFEGNGRRIVFLQLDLNSSELPLQLAFPLLVANAIEWLGANAVTPLVVEAGTPATWNVAPDGDTVIRPDGRAGSISRSVAAAHFADTDIPGVYRVSSGNHSSAFVVNAATASESDLANTIEANAPLFVPSRRTERQTSTELFMLFVAAALVVATIEWRYASGRSAA
jgi:hypothetical protein